MADTVDIQVLQNTERDYIVHAQVRSDGTGGAFILVDKSTLVGPLAAEPSYMAIEEIRWAVQGAASVKLDWNHNANDEALTLSGNGYDDFSPAGGLKDPRTAGGTGDLLVTFPAGATTGSCDLTVTMRKFA